MDIDTQTNLMSTINALFSQYQDNPYVLQRLQMHLNNLPTLLENENKKNDERVSRINELTSEQDNFYKVFLSKYPYYYMPYNNIFYLYDGQKYRIVSEDDIHHHLLSTITDEGKLVQWKHKTKQTLIKKIKERTLFKSIPDTFTIQNVLGFLLNIFPSKTETKYFLTILGDCILKKNTEGLLFFVSSFAKKIIGLVDSIVYVTNGSTIINNFITKYHDTHKIHSYRLLKTNEHTNNLSYDIIKSVLNDICIDLLCVATHYSERYGSSDNYLLHKTEESVQNYVLYFTRNSLDKIANEFVEQCIEKSKINENINWKNMHYIWKIYLNNINVPNMIYGNELQQLLMTKITNNQSIDNLQFINVTSKYLPHVSSFLLFWEKHITILDTNQEINDDYEYEYEIDELLTLYKNSEPKNSAINEQNMIKMIHHYFAPTVEIVDNKYITNIKCNLWLKNDDINEFLNYYKQNLVLNNNYSNMEIIAFDDLYQLYKGYFKAKGAVELKNLPIVSKQFFEKYIANYLHQFIQFDKFVSSDWLK